MQKHPVDERTEENQHTATTAILSAATTPHIQICNAPFELIYLLVQQRAISNSELLLNQMISRLI